MMRFFAPVARIEAIRYYISFDWPSYMGFKSLSNGIEKCLPLMENMYVRGLNESQPPVFNRTKSNPRSALQEILKKFDFVSVKTASTPIETQKPLVKDEEASDVDSVACYSVFRSLQKTSHLSAVKHNFFRYLKGNPKLGLWYPRVSSFDLEAYSDMTYAGANLDRGKSTTGRLSILGMRLKFLRQCKKQPLSTSTTEARI
ncbi:hypothetical protein Tco_0753474 [Tanacetum coccineum]